MTRAALVLVWAALAGCSANPPPSPQPPKKVSPAGPPPPPMPAEGPRMCPADVRICPDGSAVSRNGANDCAFDPCPAGSL